MVNRLTIGNIQTQITVISWNCETSKVFFKCRSLNTNKFEIIKSPRNSEGHTYKM